MKDAMGELNMTVVVIVAIGAISAFFIAFLWPNIQNTINNTWDNMGKNVDNKGNITPGYIIPNDFIVSNLYK